MVADITVGEYAFVNVGAVTHSGILFNELVDAARIGHVQQEWREDVAEGDGGGAGHTGGDVGYRIVYHASFVDVGLTGMSDSWLFKTAAVAHT